MRSNQTTSSLGCSRLRFAGHAKQMTARHAASTHLYEIETGQQADTVFSLDALLPRRHDRASERPNRSEVWRGKTGCAPPGVLLGSGALHAAAWSRMPGQKHSVRVPETLTGTTLYPCCWPARKLVLCISFCELTGRELSLTSGGGREEEGAQTHWGRLTAKLAARAQTSVSRVLKPNIWIPGAV